LIILLTGKYHEEVTQATDCILLYLRNNLGGNMASDSTAQYKESIDFTYIKQAR
jgi:hypothetical protein